MNTNSYVTKLIAHQEAAGWSDREMARQLGIGATTWWRVKNGERALSIYVLQQAMRAFPEYSADALLFLAGNVSNSDAMRHTGKHSPRSSRRTKDRAA